MDTRGPVAVEQQSALLDAVRWVELPDGVRLPYLEQGDPAGVPVVLLHGLTDSWRSFEPILPALPEWIHAYALTQRGHGEADRPEGRYRPRDFAADLASFLESQEIDAAIIAGHSMGSAVAMQFAIDYPERTLGLVLLGACYRFGTNRVLTDFWDTVLSTLEDPIDPALARAFQEGTLAQPIAPGMLELAVAESLRAPARIWREAMAGLLADEVAGRLGAIAAPTLIVWGDRDALATEEDQRRLRDEITGARLTIYRGAGHALHWEEPERFAADLARFAAEFLP